MDASRKSRSKACRVTMRVFFALLTLSVFGVFAGAGEDAAVSRLRIYSGSEIDYPPFCMVDADGRADGFSVQLMRAALAAMGRDVTFRTGAWAEVRGWLERGEVQALPLVGRTPEREPIFDFTFAYMSLHCAIVVRKDASDIQDLNDLRGRRVAVMKADNAEEFVRREDRGFEIHTTATFEDALRELSEGRHDAVVIQRLVALRLIQETGLTNLQIVNRPIEGFRQDFCFAVREGDRETLALLNEGLALVMADGTYRHLHAKWFAALELPSQHRIVIGGDHNYPPFEYLDENGRPAGFNVDLTRAIAQEMGLDIEIRLGPWAEMREALARGETLLLVEDEVSILKLGRRMIESLGYTVLTATTPGEAMRLAEKHAGEINLLITDVVMPEMNGRDLAAQLQSLYLDLGTLYMSGYTANVIAHRGVLEEGVCFTQKPFSKKDLAVKVREALDKAKT